MIIEWFFCSRLAFLESFAIVFSKPKWRNGRRAGLKIRCPQGCVGSSPTFGILHLHFSSKEFPTVYNKLELLSKRPKHPQPFEK